MRPILYDKLVMLEDYAIDTKSTKPFIKNFLIKKILIKNGLSHC